jgi:hypothetical protein
VRDIRYSIAIFPGKLSGQPANEASAFSILRLQTGDLAKLIAIAGGAHASKISDKTTHLKTTASDVKKRSTKGKHGVFSLRAIVIYAEDLRRHATLFVLLLLCQLIAYGWLELLLLYHFLLLILFFVLCVCALTRLLFVITVKQAEQYDALFTVGTNWLTTSVYSSKRADEAACPPSDDPPQAAPNEAVGENTNGNDDPVDLDQATAPDAGPELEPGPANDEGNNKTRTRKKKDVQESVEKGPVKRQTRSSRAKADHATTAAPDAKPDVADEPEDDEDALETKVNGEAAEKDTKKRTRSGRAKAQQITKAAPEAVADTQSEADDNKQPLKRQKKGEAVKQETQETKDEEPAGNTKRTRKRTAKAQDSSQPQAVTQPEASEPSTGTKGDAEAGSDVIKDSKKKSSAKAAKESRKASPQPLVIPLDDGCPLVGAFQVPLFLFCRI